MPRGLLRGAVLLALRLHGQLFAGAAGQDCSGTSSVSAEQWSDALNFLSSSGGVPAEGYDDWSRWWAKVAQGVASDFYGNLNDCLEGSVAAFVHALPAFDKAEGDALSLEVVKHLYHHLTGRAVASLQPSEWQKHWLVAVSSLLRFVYVKWVNVPQDAAGAAGSMAAPTQVALTAEVLRQHHSLMFRTYLDDFVRSGVYNVGIAENSVLFSEAFAFVSFCRLHNVSVVLESGVYRGFSTEVWSHFADEVVAVDLFPAVEVMHAAQERLRHRANVQIVQGNGKTLLPELLEKRPESRVAVFIDGPKGELAIRLALKLREYPQVAFVAMHDMAPYRGSLRTHGAYFFTDEPWFQEEYGHLDAPFRERPDLEAGGTMAFIS